MFKKDSFTDDQFTSCRINVQDGQKFFPEIHGSRNQYDRLDRFDKVKPSTQYLPRTYISSQSKNDFKITTTCNHFQDLNQKFQELECKMFEVEKCFKEANKREMDEVDRLMENEDSKSPLESVYNVTRPRLFDADVGADAGRKEITSASNLIQGWCGNHNVKEKHSFENRFARDGCGDAPQLLTERFSKNSCQTMTKSFEKPPVHLLNRREAKGCYTMNHFDVEEKNSSTDADFLEKSKRLIVTLIDKELNKIETKPKHFLPSNETTKKSNNSRDSNKVLKIECIHNIERELKTLKELESLEQ